MSEVRYRPVALGGTTAEAMAGPDGTLRLSAREALGAYPPRLMDRLAEGADRHPGRLLAARRGADGTWTGLTYAAMCDRARAIGQTLLDRGLSAERPLVLLSGNDLEHLQLAFGAMWAGIPHSPISPATSLLSRDHAKLRHVMATLTPGLIYVADAAAFAGAIAATVPADVEIVAAIGDLPGRAVTPFAALPATSPSSVDAAFAATGPDTIAKFLFTSGSTGAPKAVVTTQRMLCSNQQMLLQTFPFLAEAPPVLVDWLPWHHTFGGSHNLGIALYNGGTLYIDDGRPTPAQFGETLRNLRDIAPTVFFNVPKGWEDLAAALEADAALRDTFFSRVKLFFFAGAGLSQKVWDRLDRVAERHCGERIRMMAGLGMTECSPSCTFTTGPVAKAGYVGVPAPGCEVRLVPDGDKAEARFRGPHVMPGYWRDPEATARAFDAEGWYRSGDAVAPLDPARPELGLRFDGRLVEDFKLSSGTFVSAGPLRARVIGEGDPYVEDAVVTGIDRNEIGLLVFPRLDRLRPLAGLPDDAGADRVLAAPAVRALFQDLIDRLHRDGQGSAGRVARALVLREPPSVDGGELTDKRTINQRAVLARRAALVDALHAGTHPDIILPHRAGA
jgi:feruloyl-CoA synthase